MRNELKLEEGEETVREKESATKNYEMEKNWCYWRSYTSISDYCSERLRGTVLTTTHMSLTTE